MKYGLKSILRTPVKTILFILLISVVTGFLSLGAGMYNSAEKMLQEADGVFKTAGEFIFAGGNYPWPDQYDARLAEARAAFNLDEYITDDVLTLEQSVMMRGNIDGYSPPPAEMPYGDYGVFTATVTREESWGYVCRVDRIHYGESRAVEPGFNLSLWAEDFPSVTMREGNQYVLFGELSQLPGSRDIALNGRSFTEDLGIPEAYGVCGTAFDVTGCDPEEFWQSGAGGYFQAVIEKLQAENNAENLIVSWDIASAAPFHQGRFALTEGAFPADRTVSACVIPDRMAAALGVSVGGEINIDVHYPAADGGLYDTYQPQTGYAARETFQVAGTYRSDDSTYAVYALDSNQAWIASGGADYVLARVTVNNRAAAEYLAAVKEKLPPSVTFELFDQGYEAATHAVYNMREMVSLITAVAALVGLAVLWFFAYLFVFRANESVRVLLRLGAGAKRTLAFLLSGSGLIAVFAGAAGCAGGYLVSGRIIDAVYAASGDSGIYDYRFSILSRGARAENFQPDPQISGEVYAVVFAAVVLAALVLCLLFSFAVIRSQNAHLRYRKAVKKTAVKTNTRNITSLKEPSASYDFIPGVPLRYTTRSILRGGARSLVVPVLFTIMLTFVFVFNRAQNSYQRELDSVYENVPVNLWITNLQTMQTGLTVTGEDMGRLQESGFVKDEWYVDNFRYMNHGLVTRADGTPAEEPTDSYNIPVGGYVYETFEEQLFTMTAPLSIAKNFSKTPDFMYQPESAVTWAEGMDPEEFEKGELFGGSTPSVLVSQLYANENGLALNDVVRLGCFYRNDNINMWEKFDGDFRIAGIYSNEMNQATIIMPDYMNVTKVLTDRRGYSRTTYSAAGFMVSEPEKLSAFKDWLETRYDPVGKAGANRRWVVIDDKALYNTIENLTRYIGYMNMLYPVMMAVVAAIGFIASSLLLKSRSAEIAALRSLGARVPQVFSAFFMEPVFLSIPGIALGVTLAVALLGFTPGAALASVPLLAVCYYLGAAAAAAHTYRKAVMVSLKAEE